MNRLLLMLVAISLAGCGLLGGTETRVVSEEVPVYIYVTGDQDNQPEAQAEGITATAEDGDGEGTLIDGDTVTQPVDGDEASDGDVDGDEAALPPCPTFKEFAPCRATEGIRNEDGECEYLPLSFVSCSDGNACTTGDYCDSGECMSGAEAECASEDACLVGTCQDGACEYAVVQCEVHEGEVGICQDGECRYTALTCVETCDDNNVCTVGDICQAGECILGQELDCADDDLCTNDFCDPVLGCIHRPVECVQDECSVSQCNVDSGLCETVETVADWTPCSSQPDGVCYSGRCTACDDDDGDGVPYCEGLPPCTRANRDENGEYNFCSDNRPGCGNPTQSDFECMD